MSLQVNDPRSRTRSKSPGRSRERSRSRDSRAPDRLDLEPPRSRQRSRSPAVEIAPKSSSSREYDLPRARSPVVEIAPRAAKAKSSRDYDSDEETEIDRQYKLLKEGRLRDGDEKPSLVVARVPRSQPRYDVERSDEDEDEDGVEGERRRRGEMAYRRREEARYELSEEEDLKAVRMRERERDPRSSKDSLRESRDSRDPRSSKDSLRESRDSRDPRSSKDSLRESREYAARSHQRRPSSPPSRDGRLDDSDSDSDDGLAYGDALGGHPSYARPGKYQYAQPTHFHPAQPVAPRQPAHPDPKSSDWAPIPECERPGFVPPASHPSSQAGVPSTMPGGFPTASTYADLPATTAPSFPMPQYAGFPAQQQLPYAQASSGPYNPSHHRTASATNASQPIPGQYAQPVPYQYAHVDPNVRYASKATPVQPYTASPEQQFAKPQEQFNKGPREPQAAAYPYRYSTEPQFVDKQHPPPPQPQSQHHQPQPQHQQLQPQYGHGHGHQQQSQQLVEITPGGGRGRPHSLSVSSGNNLAVAGSHSLHAGHPPASPLLEAYRGTYQSISPMPSPIMMPSRDEDISDLEPLDGGASGSELARRKKHVRSKSSISEKETRHRSSKEKIREKEKDRDDHSKDDKRRLRHDRHDSSTSIDRDRDRDRERDNIVVISPTTGRKRVSFYDAGADAIDMQNALNHRTIDNKTIIQVLPRLTSDEILLLRAEYKNRVKMHGKGINLAKHLRLKLGNSSFGKVAYATALGRWESEAYWANCYYQAGTSRRELLIESLIGRSNAAIREIKSCFRDTRYNDSLERCMRAELKADKFRTAVLLALEEKRQDEREPLDERLIRQDVGDLHRALVSREGGETAMINIIVLRSDAHLREMLREYEAVYRVNFARAMIAKSKNLVGETLAHILNGAINRPMRDALLLHQAVRESRTGRERSELLISRLVRLHWEPRHLELVKSEYRRRYNERVEEAIAEEVMSSSGSSEWGEFCIELARSST
ncbi:annexin ANXC4 [Penicillium brasilianum]|uniref:Annexin ANXC4 n=1 Tax=Penicillium brasilianum TaxID=104259 RepID=A0A1S9RHT9_PENBI|nr:annexin ANXC4 [Penicillium brasilianum]